MNKFFKSWSFLLIAILLAVAAIPKSRAAENQSRQIPLKVNAHQTGTSTEISKPVPVDNPKSPASGMDSKTSDTSGISAREILAKVDANHQYQTSYSEARMEITIGSRKVTKSLRSWSLSNQKAFVEFTDKRDQSRILKIADDLWLFSPSAESEVRLSGEMLKQGMAGSDFSYQDALENEHLLDLYNATLTGGETYNGRPCHLLELTAKNGAEVSYYRRKMWIDQERFVQLKEELYAPSGKLLKVSTTEKVDRFGNRYYPTVVVMEDKLRKNSNTRFLIDKIQFDGPIPADIFTRQHLTGR